MASVKTKEKKLLKNKIDSVSHMSDYADSDVSSSELISAKDDEEDSGLPSISRKRPSNLQELLHENDLTYDSTEANFTLEDISDSEEIWVFDVPKTINPKNLKGHMIKLGEKNYFHIGNDLYETNSVTSNDNQPLSFVFNTGRKKQLYKTVNVRPAGCVRIRQKLGNASDVNLVSPKRESVPFPKNLKVRHPLFGCNYDDKLIYDEKKKKLNDFHIDKCSIDT